MPTDALLFKGNFLELRRQLDVNDSGQLTAVEYVKKGSAAVIIPHIDDHYILVRVSRPVVGTELWEFPAGHIEPNEPPECAALRELREETGYSAAVIQPLWVAYSSPGFSAEEHHFYYAQALEYVGPTDGEASDVRAFTIEELLAMWRERQIVDAKTIQGIFWIAAELGVSP